MSIQENFAPLLRDCAQLMAAGENTDKRTVCLWDITLTTWNRPAIVAIARPQGVQPTGVEEGVCKRNGRI